MKRKRLGKEWKNTYIIEFIEKPQAKRLLAVLERLKMISTADVVSLWALNDLKSTDDSFVALCEIMDRIAPDGCTFQVKNSYHKPPDGGERLLKRIKVGFFE